ncbi:MAG: short-chain dehydrogenase/reductase [Rhodothermaceae bacterium]|nr:MAG: short-chain dehydrogenase/reductase [Rhodothermaceae bacterium]
MKTVLITGCSTGFGRLAAEELAARGHRVFATMRDPEGKNRKPAMALADQARTHGWKLDVLELDVTSDASVAAAREAVLAQSDGPDVVINNAGQMFTGITEAFTPAEMARQLDVNVVGIHRVCRTFLPAMRARGQGLIINVSSIAGRMAVPFFGLYHASKWAVEGYSLALRHELACTGIDVVVVEPGPFTTELFVQSPQPVDLEQRAGTYPPVAHETLQGMAASFEALFEDADAPTGPEAVVDCFVSLVESPERPRPFRHVVGLDFGVRERNAADAVFDPPLLEAMQLAEFTRLKAAQPAL